MKQFFTPTIIILSALLVGLCATTLPAYAVGNQITIGLSVISDIISPSVPGGLSATAVSSSQINLAWTASTDNIAVGGYVIRRNTVAISTTTATSYSDTGLTPATGYSYTVQAFDTSNNYSSQSAIVSATTSAASGGGGGDTSPPSVIAFSPTNGATGIASTTTLTLTFNEVVNKVNGNIVIRRFSDTVAIDTIAVSGPQVSVLGSVATINLTSPLSSNTQYYVEVPAGSFTDQSGNAFVGISGSGTWSFSTIDTLAPTISGVTATSTYTTGTVAFTTSENALSTLSWGLSTAYSMGNSSEVTYTTTHTMGITGLATNTLYYYRIVSADASGNQSAPFTGSFTTQNPPPPPDTTPPANPSGLTANPSLSTISLAWNNPTDVDFQAVRLMRRLSGYPSSHTDGVLVYEGVAETAIDTGLASSTTYFYTLFARDVVLNYSSGAIVSATTNTVTPPPPPPPPGTMPPPPPPPPVTPTTGIIPPITSTSSGPFINITATGTPHRMILDLTIKDIQFTEVFIGGEQVLIEKNGVVRTNGERNVRVSIASSKFPDILKTIAIDISSPDSTAPHESWLLRINHERKAYEAVLPNFLLSGKHPFTLSILDQEKRGIKRISGVFDVYLPFKAPTFVPPAITQAIEDAISFIEAPVKAIVPVAAPIGVAVGVSQAVLLATNVSSVYDLYLLLLKLIGLLTGLFRRKRSEPWGVVYDSVTKRPLDPAYVVAQIRTTAQSKSEAITDLDGRYGFLLHPGEYNIVANKTHYKFPSDKLKGRARDEFYDNLYFGDPFQVREGGAVTYNIPLDPVEFDWNEFAKNQDQVFQVYSKNKNIRLWIFNIIFYSGFAFSAFSFVINPSVLNGFIILVYVGILGFQIFWRATHKITRVTNKTTGRAIPFALIRVWLPGLNVVVKKIVADESGKFYFLVPPGTYYITIDEKLPDGSYHEVLHTKDMVLSKGVVKEDFLV